MTVPLLPARSPEYYRERAIEMRRRANSCVAADLCQLYADLAKTWDNLADAAHSTKRSNDLRREVRAALL